MKKNWIIKSQEKVVLPNELPKVRQKLKNENKTIVTINGSFDLLHAGHLHILYEASLQADVFFVLLNSDQSIRKNKGDKRPIIPLKERMQMMSAFFFVDYVTWFEETDPREILSVIRPDVHVNGKEYGENCIEAKTILSHGGKLHLVDRIEGLSTTQIIRKLQDAYYSTI